MCNYYMTDSLACIPPVFFPLSLFCSSSLLFCYSVLDGGDYGLDDKDMEASIATVRSLCEQIEADLIWLRERTDTGGKIQDYLIRRRVGEQDFLEVR